MNVFTSKTVCDEAVCPYSSPGESNPVIANQIDSCMLLGTNADVLSSSRPDFSQACSCWRKSSTMILCSF